MVRDHALERAVGMFVYYLTHGHTDEQAFAEVSNREPGLGDRDLRLAWEWAQGSIRAGQMLNDPECTKTLAEVMDECGVPWRELQ